MPIDFPAFAYAAAVAGGGILGYVKSRKFIIIIIIILYYTHKHTLIYNFIINFIKWFSSCHVPLR